MYHSVVYANYGFIYILRGQTIVNKEKFAKARAKLGKTQKEFGKLLNVSTKAVQSYEQGWRPVPLHVERQIY